MNAEPEPAASTTPVNALAKQQEAHTHASSQGDSVSALLNRMRSGDREAAALFITRYGSRIKQRIRGKLKAAMQSVFDEQDILSTLARRLDRLVKLSRLEASSEDMLWAMVFGMTEHAIQEKARACRRSRNRELRASVFANEASSRLCEGQPKEDAGFHLGSVMRWLDDATDRQVLSLWMAGVHLSTIATRLGLAPAAARKRWERIKRRLRARLGPDALG